MSRDFTKALRFFFKNFGDFPKLRGNFGTAVIALIREARQTAGFFARRLFCTLETAHGRANKAAEGGKAPGAQRIGKYPKRY
jgi:hypothetical protein